MKNCMPRDHHPQLSRRFILAGLAGLSLTACETLDPAILDGIVAGTGVGQLSAAEIAMGLRAALDNGVGHAVLELGREDGFFGNPSVRIPLPQRLQQVQSYLAPLGADGLLVELERQLNRGAEAAVPVARDIFLEAVRDLTINDALSILRGSDRAATDYLEQRTSASLANLFSPIMENALDRTGALDLLNQLDDRLRDIPFVAGLGTQARNDLVEHGVEFGLAGVFDFIAEEEKAIRNDPAARTSAILRRVFG